MDPLEQKKQEIVNQCIETLKLKFKYEGKIAPEDIAMVCQITVEKAVELGREMKEQ